MEFDFMTGAIESILFASGEPIEAVKLAQTLETDVKTLESKIDEMIDYYEQNQRGFTILKLESAYQMSSRGFYGEITKRALDHRRNTPLSNAALEILAIVAYNQPVTKGYIEQIRGVDCFYGINSLIEKGLLEERGRLEAPGRPRLYGTTPDFLRCFGIDSLDKLPPLPPIDAPLVPEDDPQQVMNV
ncbi:MAG: SMC-Scp complex subunit ScpB [Clostridia bacterium]|nr:SMC-Scp complex subunit ScpB [Clostridia bacterium]